MHVFLGLYCRLSNFYPYQIKLNGTTFSSAEQAYQFGKPEEYLQPYRNEKGR